MRMQNLRYVITLHGRCEPSHSFRIIKRAVNRVSRMMHREPFRVLLAGSCSRPGNDGLGICEYVKTLDSRTAFSYVFATVFGRIVRGRECARVVGERGSGWMDGIGDGELLEVSECALRLWGSVKMGMLFITCLLACLH